MRPFHIHFNKKAGEDYNYFLIYLRKEKQNGVWVKVWMCPKCKRKEYFD